jgi:hypothetical protein
LRGLNDDSSITAKAQFERVSRGSLRSTCRRLYEFPPEAAVGVFEGSNILGREMKQFLSHARHLRHPRCKFLIAVFINAGLVGAQGKPSAWLNGMFEAYWLLREDAIIASPRMAAVAGRLGHLYRFPV